MRCDVRCFWYTQNHACSVVHGDLESVREVVVTAEQEGVTVVDPGKDKS